MARENLMPDKTYGDVELHGFTRVTMYVQRYKSIFDNKKAEQLAKSRELVKIELERII